jgi:hypothetical protein
LRLRVGGVRICVGERGMGTVKRRLVFALALLAVLGVCYGILLRVSPPPAVSRPTAFAGHRAMHGGGMRWGGQRDLSNYDEVTVEIEILPYPKFLLGGARAADVLT